MPVHLGVAGPAKLQTLIKFAIACGVGTSLGVLQKRAKDVTKLLLPFEPTDLLADLAARKAAGEAHRTSSASTSSRWAGSRPMPNGRSPMAATRHSRRRRPPSPDQSTPNTEHQGRPTHDAHRDRIEDPHHRDRL
jgi:hypothetical protein